MNTKDVIKGLVVLFILFYMSVFLRVYFWEGKIVFNIFTEGRTLTYTYIWLIVAIFFVVKELINTYKNKKTTTPYIK